jgi:hypothetical protein
MDHFLEPRIVKLQSRLKVWLDTRPRTILCMYDQDEPKRYKLNNLFLFNSCQA